MQVLVGWRLKRDGLVLCAALAVVGCLGCEVSDFQVAPVSGQVTLDNEPLADAFISFQPFGGEGEAKPGPGSYARTDEQGRFTLRVIEPEQSGAVVGKHRVMISTAVSAGHDGARLTGERVPRRYRDGRLEFVVPSEGTIDANFELRTVEPPR